jgi:hypothetical protein
VTIAIIQRSNKSTYHNGKNKNKNKNKKQKTPTGPVLLPVSITNIESGGHGVECHFQQ